MSDPSPTLPAVGTSYQTILAVGDLAAIREAVAEAGREAYVVPVADQRWAVVPQENMGGCYAEVDELAELLSRRTRRPAASFDVFDSDVMTAEIHVDGQEVHRYLSDRSWVSEYWDDDDNELLASYDGTLYPLDSPPPPGPTGDDPAAFAPLAVGEVDPERLHAALRGDVPVCDAPRLFAEWQHAAILRALNLDPRPLTTAFRHLHPDDLPGAIHLTPAPAGPDDR